MIDPITRAIALLETFAESGMDAVDADGRPTPNARYCLECAADLKALRPEGGMPSRDEIIEQCAKVCDASRDKWNRVRLDKPLDAVVRGYYAEAGGLAKEIRALKSRLPQPQCLQEKK